MRKCAFCFILMFLIGENRVPTQTQNAIFLTALQHFPSYLTFPDSSESLSIRTYPSPPPAPVRVSAKEVMVVGMKQRKRWVETQPGCSWARLVAPFADLWLSFPPSHAALWCTEGWHHPSYCITWEKGETEVLEKDLNILTKNVHTARLALYSTALSGFTSLHKPLTGRSVTPVIILLPPRQTALAPHPSFSICFLPLALCVRVAICRILPLTAPRLLNSGGLHVYSSGHSILTHLHQALSFLEAFSVPKDIG